MHLEKYYKHNFQERKNIDESIFQLKLITKNSVNTERALDAKILNKQDNYIEQDNKLIQNKKSKKQTENQIEVKKTLRS